MRCSHLDGHQRRPRIAFAVRPGRASAALLLWVPALSPRTHAWKITLFAARGLLMSAPHCLVFVLGFQSWRVDSVKETNRSFDRSRSKFADPRYRPRGRITKSVTVTTAYNRTILSGTAASAQNKMAKAALHLNMLLLVCRCTRVKVIRVEVSQNDVHARITGWMTSTRAGKGRDFSLQPRGSNPRRGTCFELSEWKALGSGTFDVRLNAILF